MHLAANLGSQSRPTRKKWNKKDMAAKKKEKKRRRRRRKRCRCCWYWGLLWGGPSWTSWRIAIAAGGWCTRFPFCQNLIQKDSMNKKSRQTHIHILTEKKTRLVFLQSVRWCGLCLAFFCYLVLLSDDVLFYVLFLPKLDQLIQHPLNLRERKWFVWTVRVLVA